MNKTRLRHIWPGGPCAQEISKFKDNSSEDNVHKEKGSERNIQVSGSETHFNAPRAPAGRVRIYWAQGPLGPIVLQTRWGFPDLLFHRGIRIRFSHFFIRSIFHIFTIFHQNVVSHFYTFSHPFSILHIFLIWVFKCAFHGYAWIAGALKRQKHSFILIQC